jgi:four helix bundle protein
MSNIAEGFARKNDREFARFLDIARGSVTEVQSLLYVALDVGYLSRDEFDRLHKLAAEVTSLISGLTSYLRRGQGGHSGVRSAKPDVQNKGNSQSQN